MSTVAPWRSIGSFPSCAQHKTNAEIVAEPIPHVWGTLAEIMRYIWLLERCDITFDVTTKTSLQVGDPDNFTQPYPIIPPLNRLCGLPSGFGAETDVWSPFTILGVDAFARLNLFDPHYDTTNSNYAMPVNLLFTAGGDVYGTFQKTGWVANAGTCTIFGTTVASYRWASAPDANFSVSAPAYYTIS